jgi:hypothetical protein
VRKCQCIFGSDHAVLKLKFHERISAHEEPDCKFFKFGLHNLPLGVPGWDFTFWLNCRLKITPCDEMLSGHVGSVQAGPLIGGLQ